MALKFSARSASLDVDEWNGFFDRGVRVEGTVEIEGTFRVDGRVKGRIISQHAVFLGEDAQVEGEIEGDQVVIAGRFDGVILARRRVEIHAKGLVSGEIHSPCLIIDPGGILDGRCHMPTGGEEGGGVDIPIRAAGR